MSTMFAAFKRFVNKHHLFDASDPVLLTVSGGIDSMVMSELFRRLEHPVMVAHCNFQLRGEESEQDEVFVRQYAMRYELPLFVKTFATVTYAEEHKLSIQMAARELRYQWFARLAEENNLNRIAVAHNLDDVAETVLINLTRGTGLKGLTGIRPKQGNIIRPLLFATRAEIISWAGKEKIGFREDSSNRSVKYVRNKIRHEVIPLLREINPDFLHSIAQTTNRLSGIEHFFNHYIQHDLNGLMQKFGNRYIIPIDKLKETEATEAVLYELLKPFHFPPALTFEIVETIDGVPGKTFYSASHRLIKDRDHLIVTPLPEKKSHEKYYIEEGTRQVTNPVLLHFSTTKRDKDFLIPNDQHTATLDLEKIHFPLLLRKWQEGDWFMPLGLGGMKKLSDFFVDRKLSIDEKEEVWLLTQGNEIIWVVGMLIDDRFKITRETQQVLLIEYRP